MYRILRRAVPAFATAALLLALSAATALAHGHTQAGDYELVIGFHNEPAYQGEPNGLDLFVTDTKTGERVSGLEDSLKVEIGFGAAKRELELRAQWGEEGAYTADVLPTVAGDYTWRIWGDIKGTPVDVSMTSGPDTFGSVDAKSAVAFPAADPTPAELRAEVLAAQQAAQTALLVGGLGLLLGIIGVVVGLLGMRAWRTRGSAAAAPLSRMA